MNTVETTAELLDELERELGEGSLLRDPAELAGYEQGWRYGCGKALAVVRPRTTAEIASVLARCHRAGVRVQPQGANTGLVGASNPDASGEQLVLSFERLNRRLEVDSLDRTAVVDAGMTLGQLNQHLEPQGLVFPVDLGADPQIGGMVATNTGGTRLLRYGSVRERLLGLEVVLADGTVWSGLVPLRKDNRGLDLKQLFVGTSGTFGVVTGACLALEPLPRQRVTAWVAMDGPTSVLPLLAHLERAAGETLSAFEVLSAEALEATLRHGADLTPPFAGGLPAASILVELSTTLAPGHLDLEALLLGLLEERLEDTGSGLVDAVPMAPDRAWHLRHQVSESLRHGGRVLALDVSVPRSALPDFTARVRDELSARHPHIRVCDFGHWGDGGTHLNLVWDPKAVPDSNGLAAEVQARVYSICVEEYGGSFSAEHGVGPHNRREYERTTPELTLSTCRALKDLLDPGRRLGTVSLDGSRQSPPTKPSTRALNLGASSRGSSR